MILPSSNKIDSLWAAEAEDRFDAFDRGEIQTVPMRNVFDELTETEKLMEVKFLSPILAEFRETIVFYNDQKG